MTTAEPLTTKLHHWGRTLPVLPWGHCRVTHPPSKPGVSHSRASSLTLNPAWCEAPFSGPALCSIPLLTCVHWGYFQGAYSCGCSWPLAIIAPEGSPDVTKRHQICFGNFCFSSSSSFLPPLPLLLLFLGRYILRESHILMYTSCFWALYIAINSHEFLILLPPAPKFWNHRHVFPCLTCFCFWNCRGWSQGLHMLDRCLITGLCV